MLLSSLIEKTHSFQSTPSTKPSQRNAFSRRPSFTRASAFSASHNVWFNPLLRVVKPRSPAS